MNPIVGSGEHEARCVNHAETPAIGPCTRCGTFICARCTEVVDTRPYCADCAKRGDVDWVAGFIESLTGKRDSGVWLTGLLGMLWMGLIGVSGIFIALEEPLAGVPTVVLSAVGFAICAGYLMLMPWARWGVLLGTCAVCGLAAVAAVAQGDAGPAIVLALPPIGVINAHRSPRSRLAFSLPVTRREAEKLYKTYYDNQAARLGLWGGLLGFIVPVFGPIGLVAAIVGLRRVDPDARPPIRRKKSAIAGIILSILAIIFWGLVIVSSDLF